MALMDDSGHLFTVKFKARNRMIASAAIVLASVAPFALGLISVEYLVPDPHGWLALAVVVTAFVMAGALTWVVQNRCALLGNEWIRRQFQQVVQRQEEFAHCRGPTTFVGFSPREEVLIWDGETDLDVGLLCTVGDCLVYIGDRFRWSLAKDRVDRIDLSPASLGPRRIIVRWHAPREAGRAFSIESREARWLSQVDRATVELFKRLRHWFAMESQGEQERVLLGYPPTGDYGGRRVDDLAPGACSAVLGMTIIVVLTAWYLVKEMLEDGFYYHAVLWAGFVFVGGAVFTRCLLHYLQSVQPPKAKRAAKSQRH